MPDGGFGLHDMHGVVGYPFNLDVVLSIMNPFHVEHDSREHNHGNDMREGRVDAGVLVSDYGNLLCCRTYVFTVGSAN
jgi:hypothetical protein